MKTIQVSRSKLNPRCSRVLANNGAHDAALLPGILGLALWCAAAHTVFAQRPFDHPNCDFDGDHATDMVIWRPIATANKEGQWWVLKSTSNFNTFFVVKDWGGPGDIPVPSSDFDGDGITDMVYFRQWNASWYVRSSSSKFTDDRLSRRFGDPGDIPLAGVHTAGATKTEFAVYRPSNDNWYMLLSNSNYRETLRLNLTESPGLFSGDVLLTNTDVDGDGHTDLIQWKPTSTSDPSSGTFFVRIVFQSFVHLVDWGAPGDIPIENLDVGGEGGADLVVWRPSDGTWRALLGLQNNSPSKIIQWGQPGDIPLPNSDFDKDGRADIVLWRPIAEIVTDPSGETRVVSKFFILLSTKGFDRDQPLVITLGQPGDIPLPHSDFDGDKQADAAVYRPSDSSWHVLTSRSTYTEAIDRQWGQPGDFPINDFGGNSTRRYMAYYLLHQFYP
jgi:hypothetical protein